MKKSVAAVLLAGSLSLGACASTTNHDLAAAGTGAAIGAAGGAALGAVVAGAPIEGALIGGAIGGIAGAFWADQDNDGRADGYMREGRYYPGTPDGYTSYSSGNRCRSVAGTAATGAGIGAVAGAGVGALTGVGILEGAIAGALVGGVGGAVWADSNNDGCVDGYTRNGRYYQGAPSDYQSAPRAAERG